MAKKFKLRVSNIKGWRDSVVESCIRQAAENQGLDYEMAIYFFYNFWRDTSKAIASKAYFDIDLGGLGELRMNFNKLHNYKVLKTTEGINSGRWAYRNPVTIADSLRVQRLIPRLKFERMWRRKKYFDILAQPQYRAFIHEKRNIGLPTDKLYLK